MNAIKRKKESMDVVVWQQPTDAIKKKAQPKVFFLVHSL